MGRIVIPKGYELAGEQEFGKSSEVDKLLDNYCAECLKVKKCEINYGLREDIDEAIDEKCSFWSRAFVAVEDVKGLERKVICEDFKAKSIR